MKKKISKSVRNSIFNYCKRKTFVKMKPLARRRKNRETALDQPQEENYYSLQILQAFCGMVNE